jgi:hypothetical protein
LQPLKKKARCYDAFSMNQQTATLLTRLKGFLLPEGDAAVRGLQTMRIFEKGEMRAAEEGRWMSFTAELAFHTKFSKFRWEARTSGVVIIDAYEDGHGIAIEPAVTSTILKPPEYGGRS